ncbi:hypothetical protein [Brasilonema bromeliae]|uniref:Uncharacterized protein n=1 Tax=Brasilonema bromeliae SPC951 TaxID=385972 RepID=A0ABX1P4T6_9CYAN|nr:hypothetical protein [Brasilonema bromeliae]NMG18736.1 hypothetical protein [Brasilonema bromeliae SPC951]
MKKNMIQSVLVFALCSFMLLVSGFTAVQDSLASGPLQEQCFWMENISGQFYWVPAPQGKISKQQCYQQNSCGAGGGQSGGGCYKWAISAQAPALPWN